MKRVTITDGESMGKVFEQAIADGEIIEVVIRGDFIRNQLLNQLEQAQEFLERLGIKGNNDAQ